MTFQDKVFDLLLFFPTLPAPSWKVGTKSRDRVKRPEFKPPRPMGNCCISESLRFRGEKNSNAEQD